MTAGCGLWVLKCDHSNPPSGRRPKKGGIAVRENTCVAPVGLVWDEVIFRAPHLILHDPDGNHASKLGAQLSALVFYPIITGEPVESLPDLSALGIDPAIEEIMKQSVSSILFTHQGCRYGE